MNRRDFLYIAGAVPLVSATQEIPKYHIVSKFKPSSNPGMPGRYRGQVVNVHAESSIDAASGKVNAEVVRAMLARGMQALTGDKDDRDAWARFITSKDVVGIKVNCSGAPNIMSSPEIVAGIVERLMAVGVPARQIYIYERFLGQMRSVSYEQYVPEGVQITAAEQARGSILGYDPNTYVDVDFFGEDDTRSNLVRLVAERLTKIVNVPNLKEHQASGVTGCLKNIAYGDFSNVARSHRSEKTNTYSFIGTLASVEPLRSITVLNIMDGLRAVWHAGPFSMDPRFRFFPKRMMFGTDPVAMDRLVIDVVEEKRKAEGAPSIWDRSPERVKNVRRPDKSVNAFIREPGHVEYASKLGLGEYDVGKIRRKDIEL
ncbi:MAG TPA: DUF362 domain-containing protein [Bryobacteraceae bacterium]|nr:DUF362 domain-containing protein [Bryobacteraceae bacterium]